jgi:hypothetical protein
MKTRRVVLTVETDTDADVEELKSCVTDALTNMVGMRTCTQVSIEQVQANVIKKKKN